MKGSKSIKRMSMNKCSLTTGDGFADYPELYELFLEGNKITTLKGMSNLPKLKKLDLNGN